MDDYTHMPLNFYCGNSTFAHEHHQKGGDFNWKHFADPLGLTIGKGQGGGAANFWDPANIFTSGQPPPTSPAAAVSAIPTPAPPTLGDAAKMITPYSNSRNGRRLGQAGSMMSDQGSLEDQLHNLLGQ